MKINESRLEFSFSDDYQVLKFDETLFYKKYFNAFPNSKGIDFLAKNESTVLMIEVKNFTDFEIENHWRLSTNTVKDENVSLDIEMSQKVAMTIACIFGAHTKHLASSNAKELDTYFTPIANQVHSNKTNFKVLLFVEGIKASPFKTRTKTMQLKALKDSISKKLAWLNCVVLVEDIETHKNNSFSVHKITV